MSDVSISLSEVLKASDEQLVECLATWNHISVQVAAVRQLWHKNSRGCKAKLLPALVEERGASDLVKLTILECLSCPDGPENGLRRTVRYSPVTYSDKELEALTDVAEGSVNPLVVEKALALLLHILDQRNER